ncbi:NACHT, LRR and PYD domains-containing protein 3 isoform X2 [Hydra vulgaris]|uniref:NACHT, LRR and PYD domains-containing protein 3 isoform X2 n=1 Tax=Hydra vulgaris TaxID=6087 RepID=UPI0032EA326A
MDEVLQNPVFQIKLSELLGQDWFKIGIYLNIEQRSLESIKSDSINVFKQECKAYEMLKKWFNFDEKPTFEKLKLAILSIPKMDLLKEVEDLASGFFTMSSYLSEGASKTGKRKLFKKHPNSCKKLKPFAQSKSDKVEKKRIINENSSNPLDVASRVHVNKDISEVCTALKNYYLKYYGKINELRPLLKTHASVDLIQKFVDLCIVDAYNAQIDVVGSNERKQFLQKQMSYTPIPYSKVFMNEKSVILISGIAGIGKTWLLRKCLLDWSNNLIWNNVELVFYLECRRLNQYPYISNMNELLNVFYKDIVNDFDISKHTTLFIIDGLDEFKYLNELLNPNLSSNFPIVNALAEIQSYKHVVAGRVYAIDKCQNIYTEHIDKLTIQIMGFNQDGVENYVENHVIEEKKEVVKATLKESPIAKVMATVPFYLSSMCKIISDSSKIYTTSFLTMTELYANIFLYFLQKHIIKNNVLVYEMMANENNKKYVLTICRIAFELFIENKFVFSKEEVLLFINNFNEVDESLFGFIERVETHLGIFYQFAHLTVMEFCASVYAYNCLSFEEIMANEKLKSCLSMICGLSNKNQNILLKFLVNLNPSKKSKEESSLLIPILDRLSKSINCLYYDEFNFFYECFYESQSSFTDEINSIVDELNKQWFGWTIWINDGKTSYATSCDNYFVNYYIKSGRKLRWLRVYKNILSDEEKNLLIRCSTNVRDVWFYRPINFEGWKPKDKIEVLLIYISDYLITKKDFEENFLPWINLCEELELELHDDIDFFKDICQWIRCSNIKKFKIKYRGKNFRNLDELTL